MTVVTVPGSSDSSDSTWQLVEPSELGFSSTAAVRSLCSAPVAHSYDERSVREPQQRADQLYDETVPSNPVVGSGALGSVTSSSSEGVPWSGVFPMEAG